jgi:hypothetical protein
MEVKQKANHHCEEHSDEAMTNKIFIYKYFH